MNTYTAIYPEMIVHKAGCRDIAKIPNLSPDTMSTAHAETIYSFLASELGNDLGELGYTADDYSIKPCVWQQEEGR